MTARPYVEVDVFGRAPFLGNPLAVVLDGSGLTTSQMQAFARWTNLSETTFLLPAADPQADYHVRIFTPAGELPFAGHPTLGSCHAWLQSGGVPRHPDFIVQQCGVGLVRLRRVGTGLAFAAPPLRREDVAPELLDRILAALQLPRSAVLAAQQLINGPRWLGLLLDRAETVTAIAPDHAALATLALVGVIGRNLASVSASASASASVSGSGSGSASASASASGSASASEIRGDFEVRAFTAAAGIKEDPVTGSLNAALAQWLIADGLAPAAYIVSQGGCVQRDGRVRIESAAPPQADGASGLIREVWVGGDCVTCVQGQVEL